MMVYRNNKNGIRCGNRAVHGKDEIVYHANVEAIKACMIGAGVCEWLIDLGYVPEPDSVDDKMIMECGHAIHITDNGWHCDAGHEHLTYGSAAQQEAERLEATVEHLASHDSHLATHLDMGEAIDKIIGGLLSA